MEFNIAAPRNPAPLNALELTGRARTHVVQHDEPRFAAHPDALAAFLAMRAAAAHEGLAPEPFSAFRDFAAQLKIWNDKWSGKRPLYNRAGDAVDYGQWPASERVTAILHWSALPGASRHHWGSELDLIDRAAISPDYRVKLLPEEFAPHGVFSRLASWLNEHAHEFGFYRPYAEDRGGVYPEPWHLSYAPIAVPALAALTVEVLRDACDQPDLLGRKHVLPQLASIHARYIANVAEPPASLSASGATDAMP